MEPDQPPPSNDHQLQCMVDDIMMTFYCYMNSKPYDHPLLGPLKIVRSHLHNVPGEYGCPNTITSFSGAFIITRDPPYETSSIFNGSISIGFDASGKPVLGPHNVHNTTISLRFSDIGGRRMQIRKNNVIECEFIQNAFSSKESDPDLIYLNSERIADQDTYQSFQQTMHNTRGHMMGPKYAKTPQELKEVCDVIGIPSAHRWEFVCKKFINVLEPIVKFNRENLSSDPQLAYDPTPIHNPVNDPDEPQTWEVSVNDLIFVGVHGELIEVIAIPAKGAVNLAQVGDIINITPANTPHSGSLVQASIRDITSVSSYEHFLESYESMFLHPFESDVYAINNFVSTHRVPADHPVLCISLDILMSSN
jgi:hypothetical protein